MRTSQPKLEDLIHICSQLFRVILELDRVGRQLQQWALEPFEERLHIAQVFVVAGMGTVDATLPAQILADCMLVRLHAIHFLGDLGKALAKNFLALDSHKLVGSEGSCAIIE